MQEGYQLRIKPRHLLAALTTAALGGYWLAEWAGWLDAKQLESRVSFEAQRNAVLQERIGEQPVGRPRPNDYGLR